MAEMEIHKAMTLLVRAHDMLKESEVENLRKSADYLKESINWLDQQKRHKNSTETR